MIQFFSKGYKLSISINYFLLKVGILFLVPCDLQVCQLKFRSLVRETE